MKNSSSYLRAGVYTDKDGRERHLPNGVKVKRISDGLSGGEYVAEYTDTEIDQKYTETGTDAEEVIERLMSKVSARKDLESLVEFKEERDKKLDALDTVAMQYTDLALNEDSYNGRCVKKLPATKLFYQTINALRAEAHEQYRKKEQAFEAQYGDTLTIIQQHNPLNK